jgi:hypothetical protein
MLWRGQGDSCPDHQPDLLGQALWLSHCSIQEAAVLRARTCVCTPTLANIISDWVGRAGRQDLSIPQASVLCDTRAGRGEVGWLLPCGMLCARGTDGMSR